MRILTCAAAAAIGLSLATGAMAETTVIEKSGPDEVVVEKPASESTTIEKRESSDGCSSKTVTKENDLGDRKSVTTEACD